METVDHPFQTERRAKSCAYPSIVGGGKNACVLHYSNNSDLLNDGELVLVDAGCEYKNYASDILFNSSSFISSLEDTDLF